MIRMNAVKSIGALALILGLATNLALAGNPNPKVLPVDAMPYGMSYGQWGDAWWQWVWSIPLESNPAFDTTGDLAASGQSGPVWFLAGALWWTAAPEIRVVERNVVIPGGKALFFPVANSVWVNLPDWCDNPWSAEQEQYARGVIDGMMDGAYGLSCEIDGEAVKDLLAYRCQTAPGGAFMVNIPEGDIWGLVGNVGACSGTVFQAGIYGPSLQDGVYLMLAPLKAGNHTIHFAAVFADGNGLDVTYNLTVLK